MFALVITDNFKLVCAFLRVFGRGVKAFFELYASSPLVYFEERNFLRHRAHKLALRRATETLLQQLPDDRDDLVLLRPESLIVCVCVCVHVCVCHPAVCFVRSMLLRPVCCFRLPSGTPYCGMRPSLTTIAGTASTFATCSSST
jgi:hypothetical protein